MDDEGRAPIPDRSVASKGEEEAYPDVETAAVHEESMEGKFPVDKYDNRSVDAVQHEGLKSNRSEEEAERDLKTFITPGPSRKDEEDPEVDGEVRSILSNVEFIVENELEGNETIDKTVDSSPEITDGKSQISSPKDSVGNKEGGRMEGNIARTEDATTTHAEAPLSPSEERQQTPSSPSTSRATNLTVDLQRQSQPPEPEPEIRFNFHLFLEQLRHRTADPVARYLRSFLVEFGKKQWSVQEQVRIIADFLAFISGKMGQCEVWREATEAEFDNAREGMEKLVMNRLYTKTFSPEIPEAETAPAVERSRRRAPKQSPVGRHGQHQEDIERDHVLSEKMQIFGWVEAQHLDVPLLASESKRFLSLAQQELLKMDSYRAPRDKVICILNACKVIFGLLRSSKGKDTSADAFMPLLIHTVLRAKPKHMVSNIQYIFRFRNQDKLGGEAGYYLSSLMGAVQFIENLDRTALSISDEEFERHVEKSVAEIAERQTSSEQQQQGKPKKEKLLEPMGSKEPTSRSPSRLRLGDPDGPVSGIIRNIQKPLSNLGRMFSDDAEESNQLGPPERQLSVTAQQTTQQEARGEAHLGVGRESRDPQQDRDVKSIVETLSSMFPTLDQEVITDIVIAKDARIGPAVDACLNMSS